MAQWKLSRNWRRTHRRGPGPIAKHTKPTTIPWSLIAFPRRRSRWPRLRLVDRAVTFQPALFARSLLQPHRLQSAHAARRPFCNFGFAEGTLPSLGKIWELTST